MIPRWLMRSALMGVIFAVFYYGLDRVIDPTALRSLEVAALLLLGGTLTFTGAAIGAAWIDVESQALDWLLYAQLSILICITFRLLDSIIDSALIRALASATLVTVGGCVVSIGGSTLARRWSGSDRASLLSHRPPSERRTPTAEPGQPEQDQHEGVSFDDFQRRVRAAVAEFTGVRPERVTSDRLLCAGRGSLGIDGADADDLLALLHDRFGTTFVGFRRDSYFGPERSFDLISCVYRSVVGRDEPLRPLTVGELARYMWGEELSLRR